MLLPVSVFRSLLQQHSMPLRGYTFHQFIHLLTDTGVVSWFDYGASTTNICM